MTLKPNAALGSVNILKNVISWPVLEVAVYEWTLHLNKSTLLFQLSSEPTKPNIPKIAIVTTMSTTLG